MARRPLWHCLLLPERAAARVHEPPRRCRRALSQPTRGPCNQPAPLHLRCTQASRPLRCCGRPQPTSIQLPLRVRPLPARPPTHPPARPINSLPARPPAACLPICPLASSLISGILLFAHLRSCHCPSLSVKQFLNLNILHLNLVLNSNAARRPL
jgi:hypothetical protein